LTRSASNGSEVLAGLTRNVIDFGGLDGAKHPHEGLCSRNGWQLATNVSLVAFILANKDCADSGSNRQLSFPSSILSVSLLVNFYFYKP